MPILPPQTVFVRVFKLSMFTTVKRNEERYWYIQLMYNSSCAFMYIFVRGHSPHCEHNIIAYEIHIIFVYELKCCSHYVLVFTAQFVSNATVMLNGVLENALTTCTFSSRKPVHGNRTHTVIPFLGIPIDKPFFQMILRLGKKRTVLFVNVLFHNGVDTWKPLVYRVVSDALNIGKLRFVGIAYSYFTCYHSSGILLFV